MQVEHVFSTQTQGTCQDQLASSQLCYEAAASVASPATVTNNITTNSKERRTFTDNRLILDVLMSLSYNRLDILLYFHKW